MSDENVKDDVNASEASEKEAIQESPKETEKETPKPAPRRGQASKSESSEGDTKPAGDAEDQVVLYVNHPMYWPGVGRLATGYNVTPAEKGKLWLDKGWARKASAKEVKEYYGA